VLKGIVCSVVVNKECIPVAIAESARRHGTRRSAIKRTKCLCI
jgi:hypothetical protein